MLGDLVASNLHFGKTTNKVDYGLILTTVMIYVLDKPIQVATANLVFL